MRAAAKLWLLGAVAAAVVALIDPYEHGVWLVAYLFLVGAVAQDLLRRGQIALIGGAQGPVRAQTLLWNLGVVLVPAGVLADVRLPVALGSIALLAALLLLQQSVRPANRGPEAGAKVGVAYAVLLVFMLVSVVTGMLLASDIPWTG